VNQLNFSASALFGDKFILELNEDETFSLFSILEFVHRESGGNGSLSKRISSQEVELAEKLHKDIQPYIEEFEYEVK
jgi:hypothetical protein